MKSTIQHPSAFLSKSVAAEIMSESDEAERHRNLTGTQRNIIHQQKWFNLYVPKVYGGLELSLPEVLRIEECLGWADGSTAWVVTLCSGAAWFVGFLDPALAEEVFAEENVCFAGSGAVTGVANKTNSCYEIEGYWKYATGSLLASVFTVNCQVRENGSPLYHPDGSPVITSFLLKKDEVIVHNTWSCMGMIATGSHAIEVKNVVVSLNRSFRIHPSHTTLPQHIFKFPFQQLAETTLAVNLSGIGYRFLDLCEELFSTKENKALHTKLCNSRKNQDDLRKEFYFEVDTAWEELASKNHVSEAVLNHVSNLSHQLVHRSRALVNEFYGYCGLEAADTRNEINRVWRNFHTASQHSLFGKNF